MSVLTDHLTRAVILAGPDFDTTPEAPPGSDGLLRILNWVAWGASAICLLTFIGCAAWLAFSVFQGGEFRAGKGIVITIVATVLVGSASTIFAALT